MQLPGNRANIILKVESSVMLVNLNTLELLPEELERVKEEVRRMAYQKWCESGCPADDGLPCWAAAEREWIEREYVPHREDLPRS